MQLKFGRHFAGIEHGVECRLDHIVDDRAGLEGQLGEVLAAVKGQRPEQQVEPVGAHLLRTVPKFGRVSHCGMAN